MRNIITIAVVSSAFFAALPAVSAQEMGAGASAQPQLPAAVATPGNSPTVSPPKPRPTSAPEDKIAAPDAAQAEPNMKAPKDGGKSNSYMIKDAPLPGDHVMGKPTAPLIMIEYASLSCPHCAHFSNTVLPELKKRYIDSGQMRYILRQFPLNDPALKAAELLDCVGEQNNDKYFLFAKVLFESQNKWAFDSNFLANLETIATVGGVSKEQFHDCTSSTDREIKVLKDKKLATDEVKVPHTPYIFVGDEAYAGEPTVEAVSAFIDKKLAENMQH